MTRMAAFVNLSNWDGEDYKIKGQDGTRYIVKPGDYVMLEDAHDCIDFHATPFITEGIGTKPFIDDDGKQVIPTMRIAMSSVGRS